MSSGVSVAGRLLPVAAVLVLLAGCGGSVESLSFKEPPATTAPATAPPDTLPPGLETVGETPAPGATTTTVPAVGPGPASLNGTVTGPAGPVPGAVVEIDRFVGYAYASARTATGADGSWSFRNIMGGAYRVRAWQSPSLDLATPQLLFLTAGQPQSVSLQLQAYGGQQVQVAINPAVPYQGEPATLVVQVDNPQVDADGLVTSPPVVGAPVTLVNGAAWQVNNGNPIKTNFDGQASFEVECTAVGNDPLAAQVGTNPPVSLQMPSCTPPPAPPAPTTTAPSPGSPGATTTTTCPSGGGTPGSTTTTLNFGQC